MMSLCSHLFWPPRSSITPAIHAESTEEKEEEESEKAFAAPVIEVQIIVIMISYTSEIYPYHHANIFIYIHTYIIHD